MFKNRDLRYIKKHVGKGNPFTVPDGYFDNLASRVMENVSNIKEYSDDAAVGTRVVKMSPFRRYRKAVIGVAASVCVALFSLGAYFNSNNNSTKNMASTESQHTIVSTSDYSTLDAALDYSMMDTDDMYAYMADLN